MARSKIVKFSYPVSTARLTCWKFPHCLVSQMFVMVGWLLGGRKSLMFSCFNTVHKCEKQIGMHRPLSRQKFAAENDPPKIRRKKYGAPNSLPNFVRWKSAIKINHRRKCLITFHKFLVSASLVLLVTQPDVDYSAHSQFRCLSFWEWSL